MKSSKATVVCLLMITATWRIARAGDLNPPVGPVAPTQRTPVNANMTPGDADSLFKITLPGSYHLTGNITGVAGKHGIEIAAIGVTLDLNGFDLAGVPAMGTFDGVSATVVSLTNIAIVNGSVRNWGDEGVDLGTGLASNCRVEGVLASGNAGSGINTSSGCAISKCSAYANGVNGISATAGSTVSNCSAYLNTGSGIFVDNGSTVADCTARGNTLDGIRCVSECIVRGNTCSLNDSGAGDGANIHAFGTDNRIEANNCNTADRGIDVDGAGNLIIRNSASGNTTNYDIVAGNFTGTIVATEAAMNAATNSNVNIAF